MRGLIPALLTFTLTVSVSANDFYHYLLLPETLPTLSRLIQPSEFVFEDEGVVLLKVDASRIDTFSEKIHEERKACGGFIDVTHRIQKGQTPTEIVWTTLVQKRARQAPMDRVVVYSPEIANLVKEGNADQWLSFLSELIAFPDRSATTENGVKAANFLKERAEKLAKDLGLTTRLVKTGLGSYIQPSVVATLPGSKPELGHVVIGGHMDSFSPNRPAADDDGSGSATVLEVLRAVSKTKAKFERSIDFVWYAAEERGLVGSSYVVDDFKANKISVEAAIQFDMTGFKSPDDTKDVYVITDYTNAGLNTTLKNLISMYTKATIGETRCGYACSDHASWHLAGIPAVFPFEAAFQNMNDRLHTEDDKTEYLDKDHALYFVQTGLAFLGEMAKLQSFE